MLFAGLLSADIGQTQHYPEHNFISHLYGKPLGGAMSHAYDDGKRIHTQKQGRITSQ
jgi:hypothetical protein